MNLDRLEVTPFPVVAGEILLRRRSGRLTIVAGRIRRVLFWSQGDLVMSSSPDPEHWLATYVAAKAGLGAEEAAHLFGDDPEMAVARLHEAGLLDSSARQQVLREWLAEQFTPLFSLDEGTAAFEEDEPIASEQRIFLPSTAGVYVEGVRSITNGLVLRRSLGDLKRRIRRAREAEYGIDTLPLTDHELAVVGALSEPMTIERFIRGFGANSTVAARTIVALLGLGIFEFAPLHEDVEDESDTARDLELLAAIGSNDQRSLRALGFCRQLPTLDHYQVIGVPRAANRSQIVVAAEALKKLYEPASYPPVMGDLVRTIQNRIDESLDTLKDPARRAAYDRLLAMPGAEAASIQQRLARRVLAEQNVVRARELMGENDFYGAIVLLRQSVHFASDLAEAWYLLGACQERNPRWRRNAAESFQTALSLNPNDTEALIALGDLYRNEGLRSRARTCYEDVLKIDSGNQHARGRLQLLDKKK